MHQLHVLQFIINLVFTVTKQQCKGLHLLADVATIVNNSGITPPAWTKRNVPWNILAYLIVHGLVTEKTNPSEVHKLFPIFFQYEHSKFVKKYRNMMLRFVYDGSLRYNLSVIPGLSRNKD